MARGRDTRKNAPGREAGGVDVRLRLQVSR